MVSVLVSLCIRCSCQPTDSQMKVVLQVLRNDMVFDSDITNTLMNEMAIHGPHIQTGANVQQLIKEADGSTTVELTDGSKHPG